MNSESMWIVWYSLCLLEHHEALQKASYYPIYTCTSRSLMVFQARVRFPYMCMSSASPIFFNFSFAGRPGRTGPLKTCSQAAPAGVARHDEFHATVINCMLKNALNLVTWRTGWLCIPRKKITSVWPCKQRRCSLLVTTMVFFQETLTVAWPRTLNLLKYFLRILYIQRRGAHLCTTIISYCFPG